MADTKKEYLKLDITDVKDYIDLMADHSGKSKTKYIQDLIKADQKRNKEAYEKLKEIEKLKAKIPPIK